MRQGFGARRVGPGPTGDNWGLETRPSQEAHGDSSVRWLAVLASSQGTKVDEGWGRGIQEGIQSGRALTCLPGGSGRGGLGGLHSLALKSKEPQGLWGSRPH